MSRAPWASQEAPRVVVADDDPQMRQLVAELLCKEGCGVEAFSDGRQLLLRILESVASHGRGSGMPVDLVVSDVRMPFYSGLELLEMLRNVRCETPVLLMTAFGDAALGARVHHLGGVLLDKPFTPRALRVAVHELLGRGPV